MKWAVGSAAPDGRSPMDHPSNRICIPPELLEHHRKNGKPPDATKRSALLSSYLFNDAA